MCFRENRLLPQAKNKACIYFSQSLLDTAQSLEAQQRVNQVQGGDLLTNGGAESEYTFVYNTGSAFPVKLFYTCNTDSEALY